MQHLKDSVLIVGLHTHTPHTNTHTHTHTDTYTLTHTLFLTDLPCSHVSSMRKLWWPPAEGGFLACTACMDSSVFAYERFWCVLACAVFMHDQPCLLSVTCDVSHVNVFMHDWCVCLNFYRMHVHVCCVSSDHTSPVFKTHEGLKICRMSNDVFKWLTFVSSSDKQRLFNFNHFSIVGHTVRCWPDH